MHFSFNSKRGIARNRGISTLIMTTILMSAIVFVLLFAALYGLMQQKTTANLTRSNQAYEAAEAGLEFGIVYLQKNKAVILANPVNGFIQPYSDSNTSNVVLPNNSKYTITYTNPTANDYEVIRVTSTGTSDDNTATRTITQLVKHKPLLASPPTNPLSTIGPVSLSGNATVTNLHGNTTLQSGGAVTLSGSATTNTQSGGSNASNTGPDIQQNDSSLSSLTPTQFFTNYFGTTPDIIKTFANTTYQNDTDTNYSSLLEGVTNSFIWIDQTSGTAKITNASIGTATAPVIIVVNGNLDVAGNTTIYGFLVALGDLELGPTGNMVIEGALISASSFEGLGTISIGYNPTILNLTQSLGTYAKIPGSWKDF